MSTAGSRRAAKGGDARSSKSSDVKASADEAPAPKGKAKSEKAAPAAFATDAQITAAGKGKEKEKEKEKDKEKEKEKLRTKEKERELELEKEKEKERAAKEREEKEEERAKRRKEREKQKLVAKVNASKTSSKSHKQAVSPPLPQEPESSPDADVDLDARGDPSPEQEDDEEVASAEASPEEPVLPPPQNHKAHRKKEVAPAASPSPSPAEVPAAALEEAEETTAAPESPSGSNSNVAVFDVGGVIFKASAHLIRSQPTTLLAQLLEEGTPSEPNFVDCAPERFSYILDWYRYGEMHVPKVVSIEALLRDAHFLLLPSPLIVNGVARRSEPNVAAKVGRELLEMVTKAWTGYNTYCSRIIKDLQGHFKLVGELSSKRKTASAEEEDDMEGYDFPPYVLPIYSETGWVDKRHLNSGPRARVLALTLEERGFLCQFTDAELVVTLPLRLRGETGGPLGDDGDGGDEDEGMEDDYEENGDEVEAKA